MIAKESRVEPCIAFSPPQAAAIPVFPTTFTSLTLLRNYFRMSLSCDFPTFLMVSFSIGIFSSNITEVIRCYLVPGCAQFQFVPLLMMFTFSHLVKMVPAGCLQYKVYFIFFL